MQVNFKQRGFTLIEVLVVIGIIAVLAAIAIVAINPARQFAQARNTQRQSNVETILNAIGQNMVDNKGVFTCPGVVLTSATSTIGTSGANLASCLVPTYLASGMPTDPSGGTDENTGYTVSFDSVGRYLVCAPNSAETALKGSVAYCLVR